MSTIRFSYSPLTAGHHEVGIAGDFSAWQIIPLQDFGGVYLLALDLPVGVYRYKFIVDGNWIYDESNPDREPDSFGGKNSLITISDEHPALTWEVALQHAKNKTVNDHVKLIRYSKTAFELRFSWYIGLAETVLLHLADKVFPLKRIGKTQLSEVYYIVVADILSATDISLSVESFQPPPISQPSPNPKAERTTHDLADFTSVVHVASKTAERTTHDLAECTSVVHVASKTETSSQTIKATSTPDLHSASRSHLHPDPVSELFPDFSGAKDSCDHDSQSCTHESFFSGAKDSGDYDSQSCTQESLLPNKLEADLNLSTAAMTPAFYIEIIYQNQHRFLGENGWHDTDISPIALDIDNYPIFSIPAWVGKGIIYQIYPDRFCNGNPANDPDFSEWYYADSKTPPPAGEFLAPEQEYFHLIKDWNDISSLKQSPYLPTGKPDWWSFYGGDIQGVKSKLDYLQDLAIDIIYFNPLWQAKSNHKYDSADYHSIDPHFATTPEMIEFVHLAHAKGIRIILDVAFNHTGETFWAFRDCVEKGPKSPYWNWYDWKKWPLPKPLPPNFKPKEYYQCWWGIKDMPDLNYDLSRHHPEENLVRNIKEAQPNAALVDYLISTVRWWLLDIGIDGFRLDVPDEVPYWFWELFRAEVKKAKPDAWIVGEIWHDAANWVSPLYFDSVMNYAFFKNPVLEFFLFCLIDQAEFIDKIETGLALYPFRALQVMMNMLGSHDTQRIYELCKGDLKKLKLAITFQMCFIGTPHIYYGDEIAMGGSKDPDNRRPFNWDWMQDANARDLRSFYQDLIRIRKANPAFSEGDFSFVDSPKGTIGFTRYTTEQSIYCYLNWSNKPAPLAIPSGAKLLWGKDNLQDSCLSGFSSLIYLVSCQA